MIYYLSLHHNIVMHALHKTCAYVIFSVFNSRLVTLLPANKASLFFFVICLFPPINIISTNQKLMYTIQFQAILLYLNPLKGLFYTKVEIQWQ